MTYDSDSLEDTMSDEMLALDREAKFDLYEDEDIGPVEAEGIALGLFEALDPQAIVVRYCPEYNHETGTCPHTE